jgi:hypothetical protein
VDEIREFFTWWVGCWTTATAGQHALHAVLGLVGGCLYGCVASSTPVIRWPWIERRERKLHLEIVGVLVGAMLCGFLVNHSAPTALLGGLVGIPILRGVIEKGIPAFLRGLPRIAESFIEWLYELIKGGKGKQ